MICNDYPQKSVQASHAILEATRAFLTLSDEHPNLIILTVNDLDSLCHTANNLETHGIRLKKFFESDMNDEMTAFATELIYGETRKLFKKFQLLSGE